MAVYGTDLRNGLARNSQVNFTGWTPTLGSGQPAYGNGTAAGYAQFNGQSQNDDRIAKQFRKSGMGLKILKTFFSQQIGNAAGVASGAITYKRVLGTNGDVPRASGLVETVTQATRNTTTNDMLAFRGMINRLTAPASYPKDVSGNGGGGKVKF